MSLNRFPALWQLALLILILGGLLGGVIAPYILQHGDTALSPAPLQDPSDTAVPAIPTLTDVTVMAKAVFVYDVVGQRVLYAKNADEPLPLASITKVMTAYVADSIAAADEVFTVPNQAVAQLGASGLAAGEKLSVAALRDYAMIASSNDAAYTLAAAAGNALVANEGEEAFVAAMNMTATDLNLPTLRFYNATGLDESPTRAGGYGSARDVSFLMAHALATRPHLLSPTTDPYERITNTTGGFHEAENTNRAVTEIPQLMASKTGYTDLAQGNLTIAFDAGYKRPIIVTVLGSGFSERFTDVLTLVRGVQQALASSTPAS